MTVAAELRPAAGIVVAVILMAAPFGSAPLGSLRSPFALLVVIPPLALALEAFGWRDQLAAHLARIQPALVRVLASYAAWLVTSAALTLDVAAVAASSVGIAVAADRVEERRWQLGAAILGANVGSLLLPFSNLTNLVLIAGSGVGFAEYVGLAIWPQLAAAVAVGLLLAIRARRALTGSTAAPEIGEASIGAADTVPGMSRTTAAAGAVVLVGSVAAVAAGLTGNDMAVPFAVSAGLLAGSAVASGRLDTHALIRCVPVAGLIVIAVAAIASGPIGFAAQALPKPDGGPAGLVLALAVGRLLAAAANNLPAAAFGAIWLAGTHPAANLAYLVGTNVAAVATPHGSVATILARSVGDRYGVATPVAAYLRSAWRYAAVGTVAGMVALTLVAR